MDPEPLPELVHKGQQDKPKQLRATAEFCATRGAYESTGVLTAKKKRDERLRKLFKNTQLWMTKRSSRSFRKKTAPSTKGCPGKNDERSIENILDLPHVYQKAQVVAGSPIRSQAVHNQAAIHNPYPLPPYPPSTIYTSPFVPTNPEYTHSKYK